MRATVLTITCVAAGSCAGPGSRMPPGARVIGRTDEPRAVVSLDAVAGFLGAGYLLTDEAQSRTNIERTEHLLEERLGLGVRGTVYSPNFLRYEATGVAGISQNWADDGDGTEHDNGELHEAYANIDVFPTRIHPGRVYFTRIQDFQPRVFFSKLESITTTVGATQSLRTADWGLQLNAERREFDQQVFFDLSEPFLEVTEQTAGLSGDYRISDSQSVSASYQFVDVEQLEAQNSFHSHNVIGSHTLSLGEDRAHELRSRFEVVEQVGSLDQQLLRWNETWRSRFTEALVGDAGFQLERNDTNILELEQISADAGLQHQLYESLTSSLRLQGGVSESNEQSTTTRGGAVAGLNYRKRTPAGTLRISSNTVFERRLVENDSGGAVDEPHTFPSTAPEEVTLLRTFIDLGSIVVTDPTGLVFYREGIDYDVIRDSAGFTRLVRLFAGSIPVGGSILVDYTFQSANDFTLDTLNQRARAEHEFHGGLTPYIGFGHQDQNFSDVDGPGGLEAVRERSLIGGLEWRGEPLRALAEFEDRESTVLPFEAVRLRADASLRFRDIHTLTGGVAQSWFFYDEPRRDVASAQANLRWRSALARDSLLYLDSAVRYDDDSRVGSSWGLSVTAGFDYRWRRFLIGLRATHRETNGVTSDFRADEIGIRIVREFGAPVRSVSTAVERFLRQ